jgi:glycerophosphoryl diester phosphodiesterase
MIGAKRLGVWVPNTPQDIAFWLTKPVNQITTDRPDLGVMLRAQQVKGGLA